MTRYNEKYWEAFLENFLEDNTFENVMEYFDVTPFEAFDVLIKSGLIDEEVLWELMGVRGELNDE